jgi:hypothetical protein
LYLETFFNIKALEPIVMTKIAKFFYFLY